MRSWQKTEGNEIWHLSDETVAGNIYIRFHGLHRFLVKRNALPLGNIRRFVSHQRGIKSPFLSGWTRENVDVGTRIQARGYRQRSKSP